MRIQHNIMAMNAYRNYTNNVSAMQKNLEKLSSGYKINRAGDDAAGLAISEKMRAQISGLEAAQKNAKDGISLVQTAEGALTEVHDMLNRMVTLATQSANGTYSDTTDREQLQKEVNQLMDEINRIADSSNFNGIKLLDGSMDATVKVDANTAQGLAAMPDYKTRAGTASTAEAITHQDPKGATKTSFDVRFSDLSLSSTSADGIDFAFRLGAAKEGSTDFGDTFYSFSQDVHIDAPENGTVNASQISEAIYKAIGTDDADHKVKIALASTDANGAYDPENSTTVEYQVSMNDDGSLHFEMTETGKSEALAYYNAKTDTQPENETKDGLYAFQGNFMSGVYVMYNDGQGGDNVAYGDTGYDTDGMKATANITGKSNVATANIITGSPDAGARLAETMTKFSGNESLIRDGAGIMVGDEYYVWAGSDKTLNAQYGDNVKVIDIRDLVDDTGRLTNYAAGDDGRNFGNLTEALSRFTEAAADNKMFDVDNAIMGDGLVFREKVDNPSDADLTTEAGVKAQIKQFSGIDLTAAKTGNSLTLQIGDTAEKFNQLNVNISDMHAAALGLDGIDISKQGNAQAAIDKIKAAINKVSDVRGTLGATQNRLDHTINNLSVMTENIQDAESTIRDVDVAEEMMAYTKNSILIQSAQAMLAQANQIPQGVLQLLG